MPQHPKYKLPEDLGEEGDEEDFAAEEDETGPSDDLAPGLRPEERGGGGNCFFHSLVPALNQGNVGGRSSWTQQEVRNKIAQDMETRIPAADIMDRVDNYLKPADPGIYGAINTINDLKNLIRNSGGYLGDQFSAFLAEVVFRINIVAVREMDFRVGRFVFYNELNPAQGSYIVPIYYPGGHYQALPYVDLATGRQYAFSWADRRNWPDQVKQLIRARYTQAGRAVDF
ncbi:MAG: OTU domain-containing protein [Myxococcota bacterium]